MSTRLVRGGLRGLLQVLLALLLLGCGQGAPTEPAENVEKSTEKLGLSVQPTATPPTTTPPTTSPGSGSGESTVWVVMRQKANLAASRSAGDWRARGRAVHQALTGTAQSSQASIRSFLTARGVKHKPFWIVNAIEVTADRATIAEIGRRSDVERVVPDAQFSIPKPVKPNSNPGVLTTEWGVDSVRAPEAWAEFGAFGDEIVVANLDTGVQFDHPAVVRQYRGNDGAGNFDHAYNWFDPTGICGTIPCDNAGHGTHTMGTIVGDDLGGNQIGVAPHARWMAAKGCEDFGCSFESLLSSGQWLLAPTDPSGQNPRPDLRPHVINNSWGGGPGDDFFRGIVQAWVAADIFPVFSSGNSGPFCGSAGSPSDYPESYGIGAHDINNVIADFSSRGPGAFGDIKPNIAAPGVFVRSSVPFNSYAFFDGTSMAAPHVTGTVALMWSAAPALSRDVATTRELLNLGAVDMPDLSCGGAAENNNVWGEGKLDAFAAVDLSPRGPTGTLAGTVTSTNGDPIAGARVTASSPDVTRTVVTRPDGTYSLRLPVGTYDATFSAFGFLSASLNGLVIAEEQTTAGDIALQAAPNFAVSGTVFDELGNAVSGAIVTVDGTPLDPAVTGPDGQFTFPAVPEGEYSISARGGGCFDGQSILVVVDSDETVDFTLPQRVDAFGYRCAPTAFEYISGDTQLPFSGDDVVTTIPLPFEFLFYGQPYSNVTIDSNGYVTFLNQPFSNLGNVPIPSPFEPNAAIFPFWDDLMVANGGSVNTALVGSAPDRKFVIEFRNVVFFSNPGLPVNFEIVLSEDGRFTLQYQTDGTDPLQLGVSATIGIENELGDVGLQYSFEQPVVTPGLAFEYTFPPIGIVRGAVTDANDGDGIAGAEIRALQGGSVVRATTTNAAGEYSIPVPVGDYVIEASKNNYVAQSAPVSVADGQFIDLDFALQTGRAAVTPTTLQLIVPPNQTRTRTLVLSNTGSASFDFEVKEAGGARATMTATRLLQKKTATNPGAATTRDLFQAGVKANGMAPNAVGDVIASFPATGMDLAWGVGYTGNVWLGDFFALVDHEFDVSGEATGRTISPPASQAIGDMTFDEARNLLCQVDIEGDNGIHCMNPDTGVEEASIVGNFPWTQTSQRGIAYRSDDDTFYIGGWNQGVIFHIQGLSHPSPGEVISSCAPPDGLISGLAWNGAMQVLWEATNSDSDTIYELNPDDCTILAALPHPTPFGFTGAGLDMDESGNLWTVSQFDNSAYLIESGVPNFNDVPWLSENPVAGTVAPGASRNITVTVDTAGLTPGQYLASIFIRTTSGRSPNLRIPVSLIVPAYHKVINSGGNAYTDASGERWEADRLYSASAGYGYWEKKSKVVTTNQNIAGTPDQPLYKNLREDPYAYRFDNVPNGIYEIDLRFAEFANLRNRRRLYDVIAENTTVLPAHDTDFEVGRLTADPHVFFLEVTDGRLDVRLVPRAGFEKPQINAIRVTHRPDR